MSEKKKDNPWVTGKFCDERHRGLLTQIATLKEDIDEIKENTKQWKLWLLGIVGSVLSSIISSMLILKLVGGG